MRTLVTLTVGVLAIQGGVSEHILHLEEAIKRILTGNDIFQKGRVVQVKCRKDFKELDGLVIPGGETTVISVFFQRNQFELLEALREFAVLGKPVFGTCAGMILLANKVEGQMRKGQILVHYHHIIEYFIKLNTINITGWGNGYSSLSELLRESESEFRSVSGTRRSRTLWKFCHTDNFHTST